METDTERSQTPKGRRMRDKILVAAERLFTTHGFHGTSMRDAASAAGLPLATTVYHFARKEQLYAAVLDNIGNQLLESFDGLQLAPGAPWGAHVDAFAIALVAWTQEYPGRVRLLLRELLDNPARVARAARLPLAPFLERAAGLLAGAAREHAIEIHDPHVAVLHLVGGLSYVIAARPTVDRMLGPERARAFDRFYEAEALAFARAVLGIAPAKESPRGSRPASPARPPRARASRTPNNRRGARA